MAVGGLGRPGVCVPSAVVETLVPRHQGLEAVTAQFPSMEEMLVLQMSMGTRQWIFVVRIPVQVRPLKIETHGAGCSKHFFSQRWVVNLGPLGKLSRHLRGRHQVQAESLH